MNKAKKQVGLSQHARLLWVLIHQFAYFVSYF